MVTNGYVPDRGDLVWLDLSPQAGHEQAGRRPALVLSPRAYNDRAGFALVCPISNQQKGYPFEVPVPRGCGANGVIIADQLKSVDWRARHADAMGSVGSQTLAHVLDLIEPLLFDGR